MNTRRAFILSAGLLIVAPLLICAALVALELALRDRGVHAAILKLPEQTKRIIDIQVDVAKLFIGFATSVMGALAYYVKNRRGEFTRFSPLAMTALILAFVACLASIYFGQIWITAIVVELSGRYFSPSNAEVAIPQIAQYVTFLAALIWGAIVVVVQERYRTETPPSPDQPKPSRVGCVGDEKMMRGSE
jgi:hypothetical protein